MTENSSAYTRDEKNTLLDLARRSILHGIEFGSPLSVNTEDYSSNLLAERACFVTLKINDELRGCIGSLVATQPLVIDVAENAFSAAFRDPRFAKLTKTEFENIAISISVLTPPTPLEFTSEQDLLNKIRPGIDGLVLSDGSYRGTFLPAVWESIQDPREFLQHLKLKANLPADYWSDTLTIERYTAESIE